MMDHEIRQSGLAGNFCALVYELDGSPDEAWFTERTEKFMHRFPEINVRLKQRGRRYIWEQSTDRADIFSLHPTSGRDEALATIEAIINESSEPDQAIPVTFHLISSPQQAFFMMRWFHPICDAKGAELIVHHFLNDVEAEQGEDAFAQLTSKWSIWKKISMMFRAKRHIDRMDRISSSLPSVSPGQSERLKFHVVSFDGETSKKIMARSMKEAGMMGTALYFIGCLMRALEKSGCEEKDGFCVPYAMNIRKRKALFPIVGNQVTFLFAQAAMQQVRDRKLLFTALREQHKQVVRDGLDHALIPLMQAGSWLPLEKFGTIIRNTPKGEERSSFWFSYTGEPDPKVEMIAGVDVKSTFQLSQVTAPPSLAMLVSQYNGIITLSFNYVAGRIDRQWLDQLISNLSDELQPEG